MNGSIGNWLLVLGVFFVVVGLIVKSGLFGWIGHLPGDIYIKREGFKFYFPLASMIIISIALSALIGVIRKFFG